MGRLGKVLIAIGVVLCALTALWRPVVEPRLVRLPNDVDRTDTYSGTFVTFVDQATGATLTTPTVEPLTISRFVFSVPGETSSSVALLHETATAHMGSRTVVQENVYAVDRRTMENVSDPRAWTFVPGNVVDRSGSYYVTLPMGLKDSGEQLNIWKPEAAATYPVQSTTPATGDQAGAAVVNLHGEIPSPLPVASYERDALKAQGLPMELTAEQSAAQLAAAGVDAAALAPVLAANLTADEMAVVTKAITAPVPLNYFVYGNGELAAEPTTGGLVALTNIVDGMAVKPDMSGMSGAVTALSNHKDVPQIAALLTTLDKVATAAPQPVYELRYTQTPDSVTAAANYAVDQANKVDLATETIPRALLAGGVVALVAGALLVWRTRRSDDTPEVVDLTATAQDDEQPAPTAPTAVATDGETGVPVGSGGPPRDLS